MKRPLGRATFGVLLLVLVTAAGGPSAAQTAVRPGAPGEPSRPVTEGGAAPAPAYTEADVVFMQDMIHHHAQALEMAALLPTRGAGRAVRMLAERIAVTQADEIAWMQGWLRDRGHEAPEVGATMQHDAGHHENGHHASGHGSAHGDAAAHAVHMPGMLTPGEMAALAAAHGRDFDRFFLQYMIRHHQGALIMVADLLAGDGGQAPEVYRFAADVDADQRAEIARMTALLDVPPLPFPTRQQP